MDRELKREPGGSRHYTRNQLVVCGNVPGRPDNNLAWFCQPLWDFTLPKDAAQGGYYNFDLVNEHMEDEALRLMQQITGSIEAGLNSRQNFTVKPDGVIFVDFHRAEGGGPIRQITVTKTPLEPVVIDDDFSENWEFEEWGKKVWDAIIEVAAIDVREPTTDDDHPKPTVEVLLFTQLHPYYPWITQKAVDVIVKDIGEMATAQLIVHLEAFISEAPTQGTAICAYCGHVRRAALAPQE